MSDPFFERFLVMGVASASSGAHEGCENFEKATTADSKYEKISEKVPSANEKVELHVCDSEFPILAFWFYTDDGCLSYLANNIRYFPSIYEQQNRIIVYESRFYECT